VFKVFGEGPSRTNDQVSVELLLYQRKGAIQTLRSDYLLPRGADVLLGRPYHEIFGFILYGALPSCDGIRDIPQKRVFAKKLRSRWFF
jgi:hypothetical protein